MIKENYRIRKVKVEIKGKFIEYDEFYVVDDKGNEIFDRNVEIENDRRLYDIYKKQNNLLTNNEIKNIRKIYNLTQKDFALILGFGEVTINRIEKGSIQSDSVNSIIKLSQNPNNMLFLLEQNRNDISKKVYDSTLNIINKLKELKSHAIADLSRINKINNEIKEEPVLLIAENVIKEYNNKIDELVEEYGVIPEYITNLKLQKLLYFIQAICLLLFDKPAFSECIYAWDYGPVINEVYQKYKSNKKKEIVLNETPKELSKNMLSIIQEVIRSYGTIEATKLIDFTHEEDPWKDTIKDGVITCDNIKEYYQKVYF